MKARVALAGRYAPDLPLWASRPGRALPNVMPLSTPLLFLLAVAGYVAVAAIVYEPLEGPLGRPAALAVSALWPPVVLFFPYLLGVGCVAWLAWRTFRWYRERSSGV